MTRIRHPPVGRETLRAGGGLLDRRIFLASGLAAGTLGSSARAETLSVPPWMTMPGSPFTPYGQPSRFEDKAVRVWANPPNAPGTGACDPILDEWNGGPGKIVEFFRENASHTCFHGAITTGAIGPYQATYKNVGKLWVFNSPVPRNVDFPIGGVESSLQKLHLVHYRKTTTVHGKKVGYLVSVGCKSGKRPWSVTITDVNGSTGQKESQTYSNTAGC